MSSPVAAPPVAAPPAPAEPLDAWREAFYVRLRAAFTPGIRILDVGSGRRPAIPPEWRPAGAYYVGLDLSQAELLRAPPGSYDAIHVADVAERLVEIEGSFDLVVSWQVLEHVRPLEAAFENMRAYLRPGGRLVAQFSGKFSAFGLVNAVVPRPVGTWAMERLLSRSPETVFPAYYDRCWYGALRPMFEPWAEFEVTPRYNGVVYFRFSRILRRLYSGYERWVQDRGYHNLATHYLVVATR